VVKNKYIMDWEENRQKEMKDLLNKGVIPFYADIEKKQKSGDISEEDQQLLLESRPLLMGQAAGAIKDVKPAAQIIAEMINGAIACMRGTTAQITPVRSKL